MYLSDDLAALIADVTGNVPVRTVAGAGGGGSKGGGGSASTAPDTLFSTATIRLVDLLGEGEIVGVRGGLKGVYLNDIPVQNGDNSFNFKGITAEFRNGTADQAYMAGYPDVQTPKSVGVKVQQQTPVIASISETEATRVRVTLQFPALFLAKSDGSVANNSVQYRVEARYSGGPWVNQIGDQTLSGKTTSGYFRSHDVNLPVNGAGASAPWQVRVTRVSPDTEDFNNRQSKYTNQSDVIFYSTTSIVDAKFGYPNSALVGLTAQASLFGSSVPGRTYLVDGVLMAVPSNYDPVARTYSGMWDGTFKQAFSNNPAWALYLILSSDRFGLGDVIDSAAIDKWSLYEIARYCDVMVPDGKGGQEPRFAFNGVISTQQEAFELLQLVAQVFQGFNYWSSGTVTATQDRPADPILLVTEANVIDGEISYASSGRRARHTVAIVAWNDPSNLYKTEYEVVEDRDGLARYGYNPVRVDVLGCTSRGQAHRAGLWKLFTELRQTQIATYTAGLDHAVARPGDVVAIQDPQIANLDISGRLLAGSTASNLQLDRPVTLVGGTTYTVSAVMPDGTVGTATVSSGTAGTVTTLPLSPGLPSNPDPSAVWLLAGPVKPQQFRIISIREVEPHKYSVTAFQHEPGKYATIDTGAAFEAQTYSTFPDRVAAPTNVSFREGQYTDLGQPKQSLTVSWTSGDALTSSGYYVTAVRPSGTIIDLPRRTSTTADFQDVELGTWTFFITAYGLNGKTSTATQASYTVVGWAGQTPTTVSNLQVLGGGNVFGGRSCTLTWTNTLGANTSPYPIRNAVSVYDVSTNALLHKEILATGQTSWTYDYQVNVNEGGPRRSFRVAVSALSATGVEGPPTSLAVSNPPPDAIVPTLQATSETIFVSLPTVTDKDFAGYLVWISPTSGFTPTAANVTADDASTFQTYRGANNTTYYVRVAAYDAFSKDPAGLNISAEYSVTCSATAFDTTAPAIPTGVTIGANTVDVASDGTVTGRVTVNWTAVTSSNLGKYEIAFAPGNNPADSAYLGGTFASANTATKQGFVPGQTYSVKVRSISQNGFGVSGWSSVVTFTAAQNLTPPGNPINFAANSGFEAAYLSWTNPADRDLLGVEVWAGTTNALGSATKIATASYPTTFYRDVLATTAGRYYWLRAVNTSGTAATSFVGPLQATSAAIQSAQIAAQAVDSNALKLGSVTASKLAITSQNLAFNADGSQGQLGYAFGTSTGTPTTGQDANAPTGASRYFAYFAAAVPANNYVVFDFKRVDPSGNLSPYPVVAGNYYELSMSFAGSFDSCAAQLLWYDASNNLLGASTGTVKGAYAGIGGAVDTYNRSSVVAQAPANATQAVLRAYCATTIAQAAGATTGPSAIMFGNSALGREPSPYVDWQVTAITGGTLITGTVLGNKITARSLTADRIAAGAITANEIAANTITTNQLATDVLTANNVKIGNGTLTTLFAGTNTTTIDGGALSANSISANRIRIGSRGINTVGIEFQMQRDGNGNLTNVMSWSAGYVLYTANDGSIINGGLIPAGSFNTSGGYAYAYWNITNPAVIQTGVNNETAIRSDPNNVIMAAAGSNAQLAVFYGATVIDGTKITALSIDTLQLRASAITADKIAALAITAGKIAADAVTASNIQAGAVNAKHITISDNSNMLLNGDFGGLGAASTDGWQYVNGYADNSGGGSDPGGYHRLVSTSNICALAKPVTVNVGDVVYISAMVYNTRSDGNAYLQVNWNDASGNYVAVSYANFVSAKNSWQKIEGQVTAPYGAQSANLYLVADTSNSSACYWGRCQMRRAAGGTLIVDGSITAVKIAANSITADRLTVGADATNLIWNSDGFIPGYASVFTTQGSGAELIDVNTDWALNGLASKAIHIFGQPAANNGVGVLYWQSPTSINNQAQTIYYPAQANATYEFSAYLSVHRCAPFLNLQFFDANKNELTGGSAGTISSYYNRGAPDPVWRSRGFVVAPANTVYFALRVLVNFTGENDPYCFMSAPYVAIVPSGTNVYSPYTSNGSKTTIVGGQIATNSITANQIAANTITANSAIIQDLAVGTIKIANGSISQFSAQSNTGTIALVQVNSRGTQSRFGITGFFRGNTGLYSNSTPRGELLLEYSFNGSDWGVIERIDNVNGYLYTSGNNATSIIFMPTVLPTTWAPGASAGAIQFRARTTNGANLGGVYIGVTELAK